jgi:signal transduction histidine kinase
VYDALDRGVPPDPERLRALAGRGSTVLVYDDQARLVATAGSGDSAVGDQAGLASSALAGTDATAWVGDDDAFAAAAAPVTEGSETRGAVVVLRPAGAVDDRITRLWAGLAALGAVVLVLAALLAVAAASWVSRPLRRLEGTARGWAEGRLEQRTSIASGPAEVRELAETFNAMAGRLEALLYGSRAVVADVSHQLRTPLSAIRLRLDLLRDESGPAAEEDLAAVATEIDRLSRLVDGLLSVARAEQADSIPEPVDLVGVVSERRSAWEPVATERHVAIDVDTDPVTTLAMPDHLEQVLDNLIANALDAVDSGGHIVLACAPAKGRAVLRVIDDGPGMSETQKQQAFHRFAGGSTSGGAGLGLAIVHRLVTSDGGTVRIDDAPSGGTVVTVDLPRAR